VQKAKLAFGAGARPEDDRLDHRPSGRGAISRAPQRRYTLILLHRSESEADFTAISDRIREKAPEFIVVTGSIFANSPLPEIIWSYPTLTVAFAANIKLIPKRGLVYRCRRVLKTEQYGYYRAAGLPTPRTARFVFGTALDSADWGDFVVLKPMFINSHGKGIHLVRTVKAVTLTPDDFFDDHPIHKDPYIVQQFIDTGEAPCHYRVVSLFGEPLLCRRNFSLIKRPSLEEDDETLMNAQIASNPVTENVISTEFVNDADVLAFARQMHGAMPGLPLQGLDILRDVNDGRLYALENNGGGNSWGFSGESAENAREVLGGGEAMVNQFGAFDLAADVLIERTRAQAR
jgi:hypothetical protein